MAHVRSVPRPAWLLAGLLVAALPTRAQAGPAGSLEVKAEPRAHVTVDGKYQGVTPITVKDLAPGAHRVELRTGSGRRVVRSVTVTAGRPATLSHTFTAVKPGSRGALVVRSKPQATVFLDGKEMGKTPTSPHRLACASYEVELRTADGRTYKQTVFVEPEGDTVLDWVFAEPLRDAPPEQVGGLTVKSDPEAQVLVDGKVAGQTPLDQISLPVGKHQVTLRTEDGRKHELAITIVQGKVATFTYQFPAVKDPALKHAAYLTVTATSPGQVTVDGKVVGKAPILKLAVKPGTHQVVVTRADGKRRTVTVSVPAGFHRTVHLPI